VSDGGLLPSVRISIIRHVVKATGRHPEVLLREGWTMDEIQDIVAINRLTEAAEIESTKKQQSSSHEFSNLKKGQSIKL
jgi:hypothetical protein